MDPMFNSLIAQFAPLDQAWLLKRAHIVHFKAGDILGTATPAEPRIYFLTSGAVALFVAKSKAHPDTGLAVGLVGSEGALGLQAAFGLGAGNLTLVVQSPGSAYAIDGATLHRWVRRKSALLWVFSRYLWGLYQAVSEMAAISQTQDIRLRYAHWLLLSVERCSPNPLVVTHAHIAQMLGIRRASVTLVAREMKLKGLIGYSRGHIEIKNTEALQRIAQF